MKLIFPKEPYDIELPYGIKVKVKPLTTATMLAAQSGARRRADKEVAKDHPDREGLYQAYLIYELAFRHVLELIVQDESAPVTEENLKTVMDLYLVGEQFFHQFTLQQVLLNVAKNASGASANGTSSQAEAPYCNGCREVNGVSCAECPYEIHALVSDEEFQAWDVLIATIGQIRFAPSGRAIGLGMEVALSLAAVRGYAADIVSILLQEAESQIIPLINSNVNNGDQNAHLRSPADN